MATPSVKPATRWKCEVIGAHPADAEKYLNQGESPRDPNIDAAELAAYTAVANLLLNMDEAVTKQ